MGTSGAITSNNQTKVSWPAAVFYPAMAGGLGWGIRGQYGHQTGALIAGILVGLVCVILYCPGISSLRAARIVALAGIGVSFGGSMTYAQTIGLTQDPALIGNWAAWRWGMSGLALKGAIWIGFCGLLLGLALDERPLKPIETVFLLGGFSLLHLAGMQWLNQPFDPSRKVLPALYFSADWHWVPDAKLKPRFENWGGLLLALVAGVGWARWRSPNGPASRLALAAMLGGAIGFPAGQCLQSWHAWNAAEMQRVLGPWDAVINWWNFMETGFGFIWAGILGFAVWLNRKHLNVAEGPEPSPSPWLEAITLSGYVLILLAAEFFHVPWAGRLLDLAFPLAILSTSRVVSGRIWPYFFVLPIALLPIAGKTLRQLVYSEHAISPVLGWIFCLIAPLALAVAIADRSRRNPAETGLAYAQRTLLYFTWSLVALNFAFFRFPFFWQTWTYRTPNAMIYFLFAILLTAFASRRAHGLVLPRSPSGEVT